MQIHMATAASRVFTAQEMPPAPPDVVDLPPPQHPTPPPTPVPPEVTEPPPVPLPEKAPRAGAALR